jgi:anti-anti-sigma factor
MATRIAEASVRVEGDTAIVDLSGDINGTAQPVLNQAYDEAAAADAKRIILNFEATEFINSTGIAVIVGVLARARQEQRSVGACGLTDHYRHIFEITRLADFMPMYDDESAARSDNS